MAIVLDYLNMGRWLEGTFYSKEKVAGLGKGLETVMLREFLHASIAVDQKVSKWFLDHMDRI